MDIQGDTEFGLLVAKVQKFRDSNNFNFILFFYKFYFKNNKMLGPDFFLKVFILKKNVFSQKKRFYRHYFRTCF